MTSTFLLLLNHREKAESGPTGHKDHIDDDVGDGLSGCRRGRRQAIHGECGERGQRSEKANANEVMPRDKGTASILIAPTKQL